MKIIVAIDSLKGSLTSLEAGNAARDGILSASPNSSVKIFLQLTADARKL